MAGTDVATPSLQAFLDAFNAHDVDAIMSSMPPNTTMFIWDRPCRIEIDYLGGAGVRPWRRITSPIAARFGGPPALAARTSAISRK
jgi:hypothetical protein